MKQKKKQLTKIFTLSAAGTLVALTVAAFFFKDRPVEPPAEAEPVVIETSEAPVPEVVDVTVSTPSPTPLEALPATACTLLANRTAVLTLGTREEVETLLREYLAASAVAPEGERFLYAGFDCELVLVSAAEDAHLSRYEDALTLLRNKASVVPVRVVTEKLTEESLPAETTATNHTALARGSRIIKQLGFAGYASISVQRSYVAGTLVSETPPEETEKREGRTLIVLNGTWTSGGDTPKRDEGEKGKDAGALKLQLPMRGAVSSYFGMRNGSMHNGVDIAAAAGTAIVSPGEGVVVYSGERGAYGYVVDINHGNGFISRLTHLDPDSVQVEYNQRVFAGDAIGTLAAAGGGGKPHLHYELIVDSIPTNPLFYTD